MERLEKEFASLPEFMPGRKTDSDAEAAAKVLEETARRRNLPLSALVAEVDALRIQASDPPNLASALRSWTLAEMGRLE